MKYLLVFLVLLQPLVAQTSEAENVEIVPLPTYSPQSQGIVDACITDQDCISVNCVKSICGESNTNVNEVISPDEAQTDLSEHSVNSNVEQPVQARSEEKKGFFSSIFSFFRGLFGR